MEEIDLASEMAAARRRREEKTARLLREARIQTIRSALRPGAARIEVEEHARSVYPRLNPEVLDEIINSVCSGQRNPSTAESTG